MKLGQIVKSLCVRIHEHFWSEEEKETKSQLPLQNLIINEFESSPGQCTTKLFIRFRWNVVKLSHVVSKWFRIDESLGARRRWRWFRFPRTISCWTVAFRQGNLWSYRCYSDIIGADDQACYLNVPLIALRVLGYKGPEVPGLRWFRGSRRLT